MDRARGIAVKYKKLTLVFAGRWFCCVSLRSPLGLGTWAKTTIPITHMALPSARCAAGHCARVVRLVIVEKCAHSSVSYTTTKTAHRPAHMCM